MEVTLGAAIVESVVGIAIDRGIKWLEERNNQQTLLDVFVRSFERSFEEYRLIHDDLRPLSLDQDRLRTLLTGNFAFASDVREMSTNDRLRQISNLLHEHHVVMGDHNLTDDELKKFIVRIIQHAQIIAGQLIDENQLLSNAYARQSLDEINQTVHELLDILTTPQIEARERTPPAQLELDITTIRTAFFELSAGLRHEPHTIGSSNIEIERDEIKQVISWLQDASPGKRVCAIVGKRGYGKTVLARSIYMHLNSLNFAILGIRADRLTKTIENVRNKFGTDNLSEVVKAASAKLPVFVIIDQLDRLASTANSDDEMLNDVVDIINQIKDIPQAYLLIVSRKFEIKNDLILSKIKIDKTIEMQLLSEEQVNQVLQPLIQRELSDLSPSMQILLREPITLTTYARLISDGNVDSSESFSNLYQLYSRKWERDIASGSQGIPPYQDQKDLIFQLIVEMNNRRSYEAPVRLLDDYREIARYLQSIHFIQVDSGRVSFNHQTLFSYCYARWFIESGKDLYQEITKGCQDFYQRPKVRQVLEFLRIEDRSAYFNQLVQLLFTDRPIRTHLRVLIIQQLGTQTDPFDPEKNLVSTLMQDELDRRIFFQAISNNSKWFIFVQPFVRQLIDSELEPDHIIALSYLRSFTDQHIDEVVTLFQESINRNHERRPWLVTYLSYISDWNSEQAISAAKSLIQGQMLPSHLFEYMLHHMGVSNPTIGCELLGMYLRKQEENGQHSTDSESNTINAIISDPVHNYHVCDFAVRAAEHVPEAFVHNLLSWFQQQAVKLSDSTRTPARYFPQSEMFLFSEDYNFVGQDVPNLSVSLVTAVIGLVRQSPDQMTSIMRQAEATKIHFNQALVAQVLLEFPDRYSQEIYNFLTSDQRRLFMSYAPKLIGLTFPFWNTEQQNGIVRMIRALRPLEDFRSDRIYYVMIQEDMYELMYHIPKNLLRPKDYRFLMMLKRKFPNYRPDRESFGFATATVAPVPLERLKRVSDQDYLRIMTRYDDSTDWDSPHSGGGVIEQARVVGEHATEEPEKMYQLAIKYIGQVSDRYISAIFSGLVKAENVPSEWIRNLIEQSSELQNNEPKSQIAYAAKSRPETLGDEAILRMLLDWASNGDNPSKETPDEIETILSRTNERQDGWINKAINSARGNALEAIIKSTLDRQTPETDFLWRVLQIFAHDTSITMRCVALNGLAGWQNEIKDKESTINLFRQYVDQDQLILTCHYSQNLLNWFTHYKPEVARDYLTAMLNIDHEWTREVASQLICVNSFRHESLRNLASEMVESDDPILRRGAARIYARNLEFQNVASLCEAQLQLLMNDEDLEVHRHVASSFHYLREEHLGILSGYIRAFTASASAKSHPDALVKYLLKMKHHRHQFEYILEIVSQLLENVHEMLSHDITRRPLMHTDDLLKFLYSIYKSYDGLCDVVMDIFDYLIEQNNRNAKDFVSNEDKEWM